MSGSTSNLLRIANPPQRDEAIRYLTAVRALRERTGLELADSLRMQGRLDEAEAILRELVRLDPASGEALWRLLNVLRGRGRFQEARSLRDLFTARLRERLRRDPRNAWIHSELGDLLYSLGDPDGAKASWRQAVNLDPKDTRCRYILALLLLSEGDLQGAIAAFREAIAIDPLREDFHYGLAEALHRSGNRDGELRVLREAIRVQSLARNQRPEPGEAKGSVTTQPAADGPTSEAVAPPVQAEDAKAAIDEQEMDGFLAGVMQGYVFFLSDSISRKRGYLALGNALAESGDLAGAISAYSEAIRLGEPRTVGFPQRPWTFQFELSKSSPHTYLGQRGV